MTPALGRSLVALVDTAVDDGGTLGYPAPMGPAAAERFCLQLFRRIAEGGVHLLVGRDGAELAFMVCMAPSGMPNCRHTAELRKAVVHPAWRGRRVVERALRALVERAGQLGVEQFVIDVREGTRAHALWRHQGFVTFGVLEDYVRIGSQRHRGHFMAQPVASLRERLFRREETAGA